jgi:hypothetical protein
MMYITNIILAVRNVFFPPLRQTIKNSQYKQSHFLRFQVLTAASMMLHSSISQKTTLNINLIPSFMALLPPVCTARQHQHILTYTVRWQTVGSDSCFVINSLPSEWKCATHFCQSLLSLVSYEQSLCPC